MLIFWPYYNYNSIISGCCQICDYLWFMIMLRSLKTRECLLLWIIQLPILLFTILMSKPTNNVKTNSCHMRCHCFCNLALVASKIKIVKLTTKTNKYVDVLKSVQPTQDISKCWQIQCDQNVSIGLVPTPEKLRLKWLNFTLLRFLY